MKLAHTALIAGLGLGACTKVEPRTEVVVTISAEPGVRADAVKLQVVVRGGAADALERRASQTIGSVAAPVQFPVRVAIVPLNGDASRVFAVEATALTATDTSVGLVRATSTFLRHRTLALPLLIEDCCRPVFPTCTEEQTCRGCGCMAARVEPGELDDYRPDGGVRGVDGGIDPRCREDAGIDPRCPDPLMFFAGTVCIDRQPALTASGEQGSALSWDDANALCAARGARLCTEVERESVCDGARRDAFYHEFCIGDADASDAGRPIAETWEWSAGMCAAPTPRRSPCCGVALGYGECSTEPSMMASYHCCTTPLIVDAGPPPACGAPTDAGPPDSGGAPRCPDPRMVLAGCVCIDATANVRPDGRVVDVPVAAADAVGFCEARGLRLCEFAEHQTCCSGGGTSCGGPGICSGNDSASTWEWWSNPMCSSGHENRPCCNTDPGFGGCEGTGPHGYHCCADPTPPVCGM